MTLFYAVENNPDKTFLVSVSLEGGIGVSISELGKKNMKNRGSYKKRKSRILGKNDGFSES